MPARDSDSESVVESVASAPSTVSDKPKRVISEEQKAKMKAGREAAAAAKANGTYVPKVKAEKAEKAVKEPKVKAAKAEKPKAKKVAKAEPVASADAVQVDSNLEKVTVDGITYWLNTANNNLYDLEGEGMGAFAGAYMPGNEEGEMVDFEAVEA
jgi:membrane protein involved in colicin uptake